MTTHISATRAIGGAIAIALLALMPLAAQAQAPLRLSAARVSIAGTSNIHPYTASTTDVRLTRLALAATDGDRLQAAKAGGVEAFEIAIAAASLSSPKRGSRQEHAQGPEGSGAQGHHVQAAATRASAAANTLKAVGLLKITASRRKSPSISRRR